MADDFERFEKRMDKLSKHIVMAHQDVDEVATSAKKITQRFQKIEAVDLELEVTGAQPIEKLDPITELL